MRPTAATSRTAAPGSFFTRAGKQGLFAFIVQCGTSEAVQALRALVASWGTEQGAQATITGSYPDSLRSAAK
jgi:hypothetical protein